jgi:hypothetical protein
MAVIKDILPYESPQMSSVKIKIQSGAFLDEIASRTNVYGERMEAESYRIFNENLPELFESRLNIDMLNTLRIPQEES